MNKKQKIKLESFVHLWEDVLDKYYDYLGYKNKWKKDYETPEEPFPLGNSIIDDKEFTKDVDKHAKTRTLQGHIKFITGSDKNINRIVFQEYRNKRVHFNKLQDDVKNATEENRQKAEKEKEEATIELTKEASQALVRYIDPKLTTIEEYLYSKNLPSKDIVIDIEEENITPPNPALKEFVGTWISLGYLPQKGAKEDGEKEIRTHIWRFHPDGKLERTSSQANVQYEGKYELQESEKVISCYLNSTNQYVPRAYHFLARRESKDLKCSTVAIHDRTPVQRKEYLIKINDDVNKDIEIIEPFSKSELQQNLEKILPDNLKISLSFQIQEIENFLGIQETEVVPPVESKVLESVSLLQQLKRNNLAIYGFVIIISLLCYIFYESNRYKPNDSNSLIVPLDSIKNRTGYYFQKGYVVRKPVFEEAMKQKLINESWVSYNKSDITKYPSEPFCLITWEFSDKNGIIAIHRTWHDAKKNITTGDGYAEKIGDKFHFNIDIRYGGVHVGHRHFVCDAIYKGSALPEDVIGLKSVCTIHNTKDEKNEPEELVGRELLLIRNKSDEIGLDMTKKNLKNLSRYVKDLEFRKWLGDSIESKPQQTIIRLKNP
jgi:hypothetical protein